MILELNEVVLPGIGQKLSMMAQSGELTCLTGGTAAMRSRYLQAMLGLEAVEQGFICIDGEPLTKNTVEELRRLMAYAPARLAPEGEIRVFEPPTVQDVFSLKANREVPISNGILNEEVRRAGGAELVAVAALLGRPVLLIEEPPESAVDYLVAQAHNNRVVVVATASDAIIGRAQQIVNCELGT